MTAISIVGMAGSFGRALSLAAYWDAVTTGDTTLTTRAESADYDGVTGAARRHVRGVLADACDFDAALFGYSAQEARYLDPQYRQALTHVHHALLDASLEGGSQPINAAVYACVSPSTYRNFYDAERDLKVPFLLDNCLEDLIPLRISHRLNLVGPSMRVQCTCSSSLLAVHLACAALRVGECDIAVVTAASISFPQIAGYEWIDGGIHSRAGQCRPFDARADGTIGADGVAAVVLKRTSQAVVDGNHIYAEILGTAANNDGRLKAGLTAPSVDGQIQVIEKALKQAGVSHADIGLIEAHGTGTVLGDPIEFAALDAVFPETLGRGSICLSAAKSNIGHTDVVAGLAGLIKTALCLEREMVLPIRGFESPNPGVPLDQSAFYVASRAATWRVSEKRQRRIAGVTSLGMGGTNVHAVLAQHTGQPMDGHWLKDSYRTPGMKTFSLAHVQTQASAVRGASPAEGALVRHSLPSAVVAVLVKEFEIEFGDASVDTNANLLDCGGDSIFAIQLVHRVQAELGVRLSVADLMSGMSIGQIAAEASALATGAASA